MSDTSELIQNLRETLELFTEENISELSDDQIIEYAIDEIHLLQQDKALCGIALANDITGADFERWYVLAVEKLEQLQDGEELDEQGLLALLKDVRN